MSYDDIDTDKTPAEEEKKAKKPPQEPPEQPGPQRDPDPEEGETD